MKKLFILAVLLQLTVVNAQEPIITMIEQTDYSKDTVAFDGPKIVDVNGYLNLYIDKEKLAEKIKKDYPQYQASIDLQQKITALDQAMSKQEQIFADIKRTTLNKNNLRELYDGLLKFYEAINAQGNESLADEVDKLYGEWNAIYGRNGSSPSENVPKEAYIFANLNDDLAALKSELKNSTGKSYSISLVAYLSSKLGSGRVHIENFDTVAEKELYTVQRWVTTLSSDQLQQLQSIKQRSEQYNKNAPDLFEELKQTLLQNFPQLSCIATSKNAISAFIDSNPLGGIETALKAKEKELVDQYNALLSLINNAQTQITSWSIDSVFEILNLVRSLESKVKDIEAVITNFKSILDAVDALKTKAVLLYNDVDKCYESIKQAVTTVGQMTGLLKNQSDRYKDNLDLGEELLKFTLNDLPSEGFIKLKGSGPRESGDDLEVTLLILLPRTAAQTEETSYSADYDKRRLEVWQLQLELIGLRSETAVGIIMADPLNAEKLGEGLPDDRRFLYAPSASLLLKVGSRKHRWYNDFVDPGIGIMVSTPDFNTDGTPEFGVGGVFTVFKDILSIGYSYNVTLDVPYWHFGVNLPFNLPGIPINTPK